LSRGEHSSAVAELVGDLYEAATTPGRWPNFIGHLTEHASDCFALIGVLDREPRYSLNLGLSGLDSGAVKAYQQHFIRVNPWIGGMLSAPAGQPVAVRSLIDDGAMQRGEFFQDWLRHQPGQHPTSLMAPLERGRRLSLTVVQPGDAPHGKMLQALAPHFVRAAQLMALREREADRNAADRAVIDLLSMGMILADGEARVVSANTLAESILRNDDGIACDRTGRLVALRPDDTARLRRTIEGAALTSRGLPGGSGGTVRLPRPYDAPPVAALITPAPTRGAGLALILIKRPEDDRPDPLVLMTLHDLTPSEAEVAVMVVDGLSLAEVAGRRGVSLGTVQWQVKAILHKTGARNQADLVRLVLRSRLAVR
jgi:DNA-binding CsgD family transcriptional regulator